MKRIQIFIDGKEINIADTNNPVSIYPENFEGDITVSNGTIIVLGDVNGDISTDSGMINVGGSISGSIKTESGMVSVAGNSGRIKTETGSVTSGNNNNFNAFNEIFKAMDNIFSKI